MLNNSCAFGFRKLSCLISGTIVNDHNVITPLNRSYTPSNVLLFVSREYHDGQGKTSGGRCRIHRDDSTASLPEPEALAEKRFKNTESPFYQSRKGGKSAFPDPCM
jgi:hypothetical protein